MSNESGAAAPAALKILVYSDDRTVRRDVRLALGSQLADDLPPVEIFDVATGAAVLRTLDDDSNYDLLIFDGESVPIGGMGLAYQIKDEIANCPPVLVLVARQADSWLAAWSRAEALSAYPIDPIRLPTTVTEVIRRTRAERQAALS